MKRTEEERDKMLIELYEGEKSRNFMLHIIRAYAKLDKVKKVVTFREKQRNRCVICGDKLIDVDGALKIVTENADAIAEKFVESVKTMVDGGMRDDSAFDKYYKGQTLAFEGDGTDTCVCSHCAVAVSKFTMRKLLEKDKGVHRAVSAEIQKDRPGFEPRHVHANVAASQTMAEAKGFDKLLAKFGK